jgi:alpha-beta hydrolase superfamily lysophospholipase
MTESQDPTNNMGKGARVLYEQYRKMGIKDVKMKSYQGARHEILNETNREEVYKDMLDWLDAHIE